MKTGTIIVLIVLVGLALIILPKYLQRDGGAGQLSTPVTEEDHVKGTGEITLVEYSDFQCPACQAYAPLVTQILEEFDGTVRLAYRHFPLAQHGRARQAAQAAEAAGKQGKFFEMHDLLFANQDVWGGGNEAATFYFNAYAESLGLDPERFISDYEDDAIKERITTDYSTGLSSGVNATPTFYINGKKISPRGIEDFREEISKALEI